MSEEVRKKKWTFRTKNNEVIDLYPIFKIKSNDDETKVTEKDVECVQIEMVIRDEKGKEQKFTLNYLDMFMFIYFCSNEELRLQLQARYERKVNQIPYDVSFNLDEDEKKSGVARRRIELPVDEITMAIARNEAMKMKGMKTSLNTFTKMTPQGPKITSKIPKNYQGRSNIG